MLVQPYNAHWATDFQAIAAILAEALPADVGIEHVGSTSVVGLAAKPIIDIDLILPETVSLAEVTTALTRLGYYHNGDQGIPDREAFKRQLPATGPELLDQISHHLYACPVSSLELQRHLSFRNRLRESAVARKHYTDFKLDLAEQAGHVKHVYAELKEKQGRALIETIMTAPDLEAALQALARRPRQPPKEG